MKAREQLSNIEISWNNFALHLKFMKLQVFSHLKLYYITYNIILYYARQMCAYVLTYILMCLDISPSCSLMGQTLKSVPTTCIKKNGLAHKTNP